jgi:hypothetical protein
MTCFATEQTINQSINQAPCLAFSAQIMAMILLSSADWAACSLMTDSSTPSDLESCAVVVSMRFCNCSIFCRVLSRKGAEKATEDWPLAPPPPFGRRISSLRGAFLPLSAMSCICCCIWGFWLLDVALVHVTRLFFGGCCFEQCLPFDKGYALGHLCDSVGDSRGHDCVCASDTVRVRRVSACDRGGLVLNGSCFLRGSAGVGCRSLDGCSGGSGFLCGHAVHFGCAVGLRLGSHFFKALLIGRWV